MHCFQFFWISWFFFWADYFSFLLNIYTYNEMENKKDAVKFFFIIGLKIFYCFHFFWISWFFFFWADYFSFLLKTMISFCEEIEYHEFDVCSSTGVTSSKQENIFQFPIWVYLHCGFRLLFGSRLSFVLIFIVFLH